MQFAGLLIGLARAFPTLFGDTYPRQSEVDALHYVFRSSLSDERDEIMGEAIADLHSSQTQQCLTSKCLSNLKWAAPPSLGFARNVS